MTLNAAFYAFMILTTVTKFGEQDLLASTFFIAGVIMLATKEIIAAIREERAGCDDTRRT